MSKPISILTAYKMIKESNGKICHALFTKKNGELRSMTFRTGVTKGVKGEGMNYTPEDYYLIAVFDMNANGFRMINLRGLHTLTVSGEKSLIVR